MIEVEKYIRACIGLSLAYETYHESILKEVNTENEVLTNAKILREWLVEYKRSKKAISELKLGKHTLIVDLT